MGGGNGQKAKTARERNLEKLKAPKGSQLEANKKAMNIQVGGGDTEGLLLGSSYVPSSTHTPTLMVQGVHANIYLYHFGGKVQGTC